MSTLNRVWDPSAGPGFVSWRTQAPDPNGVEYPGPGAFGSTSDYCILRDTQRQATPASEQLGLTHAPEGLWWLDGDLSDRSGNGITLSVGHGAIAYSMGPALGTLAGIFDGATILDRASHDAPLLLLGDATFEALIHPVSYPTFQIIFGFEETEVGSLEANNTPYVWYLNSVGNPGYTHHNGARNLNNFEWTSTAIPLHQWTHLAMVRDDAAKTVTLYVNGVADPVVYTYTNSPTGGTNSKLELGGDSFSSGSPSVMFDGRIASAKIIPSALTAVQVLEEARLSLPTGRRPPGGGAPMSFANRAWDAQAGPGFVQWRTAAPDSGGLLYPGPGTFGVDTSDVTIADIIEASEPSPAQPHQDTSPLGPPLSHWPLNGDGSDNLGLSALTIGGSVPFPVGVPGTATKAPYFPGSVSMFAATPAPYRLTGALTIEALVYLYEDVVDPSGYIVTCHSTGGNFLYAHYLNQGDNELRYYHDPGGITVPSGFHLQVGRWYHTAVTRNAAGTLIRIYVDGTMVHRETVGSAPSGGASSVLRLGDIDLNGRRLGGQISSVRIFDAELRPEHILADARLTLPPELRP